MKDAAGLLKSVTAPSSSGGGRAARLAGLLAAGIVVVAFLLRLDGIEARTIGHPENQCGGIPMPQWVPAPVRRVDLPSLVTGTLRDGHPPLYFAGMLAWTLAFGHGLLALRLPSALVGTASVLLTYRVALRVTNRPGALLAAALLALDGFHVFWSQQARPYLAASFLALLSTLLLLRLREDPRWSVQAAYAGATAAALWTHLYAWPVVFVQGVWALWRAPREHRAAALPSWILAVVAATPVVALALYQNPSTRWFESPWGFFAMGNAFAPDVASRGHLAAPPLPPWLLAAATLLLMLAGALDDRKAPNPPPREARAAARAISPRQFTVSLALVGGVATAMIGALALAAPRRNASPQLLLACAALPVALAVIGSSRRWWPAAPERPAAGERAETRLLVLALSVLPLLVMEAVSIGRGAMVTRGTVVFLPYLLVAMAAGIASLGRVRWLGASVALLVLVLFVSSVQRFRQVAGAPRDYAGLARALRARLTPADLIFLGRTYRDFPLLYYFEDAFPQFAERRYRQALRRHPAPRVWVVLWGAARPSRDVRAALAGYEPRETVRGAAAAAMLFVRRDGPASLSLSAPDDAGNGGERSGGERARRRPRSRR